MSVDPIHQVDEVAELRKQFRIKSLVPFHGILPCAIISIPIALYLNHVDSWCRSG